MGFWMEEFLDRLGVSIVWVGVGMKWVGVGMKWVGVGIMKVME